MLVKYGENGSFVASAMSIQYSCKVHQDVVGAGYDRSGCTDLEVIK